VINANGVTVNFTIVIKVQCNLSGFSFNFLHQ
jgi:hypothetical protein